MKTDVYTKAVLTIIAGCLLYIVAKDIAVIDHALAQSGGAPVRVNIVGVGGHEFSFTAINSLNPTLPVSIK